MTGSDYEDAFRARAAAWWTPERVSALEGGKALLLSPVTAPVLLRAMGILDHRAKLHPSRVRKFRQLNHLLSFLQPALTELAQRPGPVQLIDAGCGRSALGFLVAWWFQQREREVAILGVDRNPAVIDGCRQRGEGLPMKFLVADLDALDLPAVWASVWGGGLDLSGVLALHACDTATDDALALVLQTQAPFFAVAPCCQAELAAAWSQVDAGALAPIHTNAHLRRTVAASVTDAMRGEIMRAHGYAVRMVEFVEAHHTPKNTLIYGHRSGPAGGREAYEGLKHAMGGAGIALERVFEGQ